MRIMLSTIGTAGDVIPFSRLAHALHARGHQVAAHAWPSNSSAFGPDVRFVPAAGGLDAKSATSIFREALNVSSPIEQKTHYAQWFYGLGTGESRARAAYVGAKAALADHDLAVINVLDHVAQAAADDIGLPWVGYVSRPPPPLELADAANATIDSAVSSLLSSVTGRARRVRVFREQSVVATLVACSPTLVPPTSGSTDSTVVCTGAWLNPVSQTLAPPSVDAFLADGAALLLTFGTMPDTVGRIEKLMDALATIEARAVVQVLPPNAAPSSTDTVLVTTERLPFSSLLPRFSGVVHHGSVGTSHEVARAGKPSLAIPHMGDQFFWGQMLHRHGLGPAPLRFTELSVETLASRLRTLRDSDYPMCADIAATIAGEDGVRVAVEMIEGVAP